MLTNLGRISFLFSLCLMGAALCEVLTVEPAFSDADSTALFFVEEFLVLLLKVDVSIDAPPTLFAAAFEWVLLKTIWFCDCKISAVKI